MAFWVTSLISLSLILTVMVTFSDCSACAIGSIGKCKIIWCPELSPREAASLLKDRYGSTANVNGRAIPAKASIGSLLYPKSSITIAICPRPLISGFCVTIFVVFSLVRYTRSLIMAISSPAILSLRPISRRTAGTP